MSCTSYAALCLWMFLCSCSNVESPFLIKKGSMAMLNVLLRVENTGQHIAMLETAFGFAHWPLTQLAKRRKELLAMKDERLLVGTVQVRSNGTPVLTRRVEHSA